MDFDAITKLGIVIGASVDRDSVQKSVREIQRDVTAGVSGSGTGRQTGGGAGAAATAKREVAAHAQEVGKLSRQAQMWRNLNDQLRTSFSRQATSLQNAANLTERLARAQKRLGEAQRELKRLVQEAADADDAAARKRLAAEIRLQRARASTQRTAINAIGGVLGQRQREADTQAKAEEKHQQDLLKTRAYWAKEQAKHLNQAHTQALRENQRRDREATQEAARQEREEARRQRTVINTRNYWGRQRQQYLDQMHREALRENAKRDRDAAREEAEKQAAPGREYTHFQQRFAQATNRAFRWYVMFMAAFWSLSMVTKPFMGFLSWTERMLGRLAGQAVRFGEAFVNSVAQIQNLEGRMRVFFGPSTSKAIRWAIDEALGKPFEWTSLSEAMMRAMALGIERFPAGSYGKVMQSAEDLAAAFQKPVQDMVTGIMMGATGNFRRLIQLGFRPSMAVEYGAVPGAGERLKYTTPEDRARNLNAIIAMVESRVGGAADKLNYTWGAMLEDMKDSWTRFALGLHRQGFLNPILAGMSVIRQRFLEMKNAGTFDTWAAQIVRSLAWVREPIGWLAERIPGIGLALLRLGTLGAKAFGKWYERLSGGRGIMGLLDRMRGWFQEAMPLAIRLTQAYVAALGVAVGFMVDLVQGMGHLVAVIARVAEMVGKVRPGTADRIEAGVGTIQKLQEKYLDRGPNGEPSKIDQVQDYLSNLGDRAEKAQGARSWDEYLRTAAPGLGPVADAYREGVTKPGSYDLELKRLSANPQDDVAQGMQGLQATDEEGFSALGDQVEQSGEQTAEAVRSGTASVTDLLGQIRDSQRNYLRGEVGRRSYTGHPLGVAFETGAAAPAGAGQSDTGAPTPAAAAPALPFGAGTSPYAPTPYAPTAGMGGPGAASVPFGSGGVPYSPSVHGEGYVPPGYTPAPSAAAPSGPVRGTTQPAWYTRAFAAAVRGASAAQNWSMQHLGKYPTYALDFLGGLWGYNKLKQIPYALKQVPGRVVDWGREWWNSRLWRAARPAEAVPIEGVGGWGGRLLEGARGAWGAVRTGASSVYSWLRGGGLGRFWRGGVDPEVNYGRRAVEAAEAWRAARAAQSAGGAAEVVADAGAAARTGGWLSRVGGWIGRAGGWLGRVRGLSAISRGAGRLLGPLGVGASGYLGVTDALHTWNQRQNQPWYKQIGWSLYDSAKAFGGGIASGGVLGGVIAGGASTLTKVGVGLKASVWDLPASWLANRRQNWANSQYGRLAPERQSAVRQMLQGGQATSMYDAVLRAQKLSAGETVAYGRQRADEIARRRAYPTVNGKILVPGTTPDPAPGTWLSGGRIRSDDEILAGMNPVLQEAASRAVTPIKTAMGYFVPAFAGAGGGQVPSTVPGRGLAQFVPLVSKVKQAVDVAVNVTVKPSPEFLTEHTVDVQQRDLDEARGLYRG